MKFPQLLIALLATVTSLAFADTYTIDPGHTYPSFEADHMGMSVWRGKFTNTTGKLVFDKATGRGSLEVKIDMDTVDFGLRQMNNVARSDEIFDTAKYGYAFYRGRLEGFTAGAPAQVVGELTLHGVTRPLTLKVNHFKCQPHPLFKRDWCGADATTTFQRDAFGIVAGKDYGFKMDVTLHIQVEALQAE